MPDQRDITRHFTQKCVIVDLHTASELKHKNARIDRGAMRRQTAGKCEYEAAIAVLFVEIGAPLAGRDGGKRQRKQQHRQNGGGQ